MNIEIDTTQMKPPFSYIAAWLVGQLKTLEVKHDLRFLVDDQPASFEEPPPTQTEINLSVGGRK